MSRIGKQPIDVPSGTSIEVSGDNVVKVKGKLGELSEKIHKDIEVKIENGTVSLTRPSDSKTHKTFHGLSRVLINNMVQGVSVGFEKKLEVIGVGYRAEAKGQLLELNIGFSHPIVMQLPPEVKVEVQQEKRQNAFISLKSHDKQLLGEVAAKIRSFRKPEPYKGKGILYVGEYVRKKEGKTAAD
ncbi:MAG: 50S ribosomal protein L6 [Bacteroidia bacterium]|nr:MAG: 50S ribosomal protein L6 [Bacteroidia bacterium]